MSFQSFIIKDYEHDISFQYNSRIYLMFHIILLTVSVYFIISGFFFLFPGFIWKKKIFSNQLFQKVLSTNKIMRVAHRGGPKYTTQNTIEAFDKIQSIVDCIQMDVCQTADKILVVHHDHHLKRTCGRDQDIQNFNYSDLPSFSQEIVLDFAVNGKIKTNKQKIPKLSEVFKKYPKLNLNIELKTPTETAMVEFVRQIHEYNRKQDTIVGIRSNKNFLLKKKHPEIMNFMNDKKVFTLAFAYFTGLVPFLKVEETSLQIPVYSKEYEDWNVGRTAEKDKWKIKLYMRAIKLVNILTRPLIWHLKQRGIISIGWVCNTEEGFENAISAGFQGIMTDDPFLLHEYLKSRKLLIQ